MPTKVSMSSIIRAKSGCSIRIVRVSVSHTTVISGIIYLTPAAKLALQSRLPHAIDDLSQLQQVHNPERTAPRRDHHKPIRLGHIGPCPRQRLHDPVVTEEEHPILTPRLLDGNESKLTPKPRMERVSHPNSSILTI